MGFSEASWASDFVHLHVASTYSLRYGVASPAALAAGAAQHGMRALALTDRDGLYGAVKHAVACAEAGIAPILGTDLALASPAGQASPASPAGHAQPPGGAQPACRATPAGQASPAGQDGQDGQVPRRALNSQAPVRLRSEDAPRVTFLAEGSRGWASLCRLVSAAHQAGQRGAPLVSHDLVAGRPGPGRPARPGQRRGPGRLRPAAGPGRRRPGPLAGLRRGGHRDH